MHASGSTGDLDEDWVNGLKEKMRSADQHPGYWERKFSSWIKKVPQIVRQSHEEKDYTPQILSIGPFHHRRKSLKAFHEHKSEYTSAVLKIGNNSLTDYLKAVRELEDRARECYFETVSLSSNQFVEMMVVDGCFIIMLLFKAYGIFSITQTEPIFKNPVLMLKLQIDLLLFENQIPYFVLQLLFDRIENDLWEQLRLHNQIPNLDPQRFFDLMKISSDRTVKLARLALNFFSDLVPIKNYKERENPNIQQVQHLLHLLHSNLLLETKKDKLKKPGSEPLNISCVTKLRKCGIKFKKGDLDIRFRKGVVTIPPLRIENITNSLLLNFITFEQNNCCGIQIEAYTTFMYFLIHSAEDVKVLKQNDVIDNWFGNDEKVVHLFQNLGRELWIITKYKEFYLSDVCKQVDHYCNTGWIASLMRKYFDNPWAIIIFTGLPAIMFLLQTLFPMLSYFKHSS